MMMIYMAGIALKKCHIIFIFAALFRALFVWWFLLCDSLWFCANSCGSNRDDFWAAKAPSASERRTIESDCQVLEVLSPNFLCFPARSWPIIAERNFNYTFAYMRKSGKSLACHGPEIHSQIQISSTRRHSFERSTDIYNVYSTLHCISLAFWPLWNFFLARLLIGIVVGRSVLG